MLHHENDEEIASKLIEKCQKISLFIEKIFFDTLEKKRINYLNRILNVPQINGIYLFHQKKNSLSLLLNKTKTMTEKNEVQSSQKRLRPL